jgi:hypothetical protein
MEVQIVYRASTNLQLYQCLEDENNPWWKFKVRDCAYPANSSGHGCPAVFMIIDDADTKFTDQWQFYLIAINEGMRLNNISALMGPTKALMNKTGVGNGKRNVVMDEDLNGEFPKLDKLRTFALNSHAGYDDGTYVYLTTMNGENPPEMKIDPATGKPFPQPRTKSEIVRSHYKYLPETHRHLFLDCSNVRVKPGGVISYGPFDNGLRLPWTGDNEMHQFFPFTSRKAEVKSPLRYWRKIPKGSPFPSPFRRA